MSAPCDCRVYFFLEETSRPLAVTSHYLCLPSPAAGSWPWAEAPPPTPKPWDHRCVPPYHHCPFWRLNNFPLRRYINITFCLSVEGYWGCFKLVTIVDNAVVYICASFVRAMHRLLTPTGTPCASFWITVNLFVMKLLMTCLIFKVYSN